jgi:site-specific DNA-methyltransferase (adenine-specific)
MQYPEDFVNRVTQMDCRVGLALIPQNYIDLAITSPPYKDEDGYSDELMTTCLTHTFRVLKPNSLFFLNFGHLAEDKERPFRVLRMALMAGFQLNDTIVWAKNHFKPIQGNKRMNNLTEFVFLLYKDKMPVLNRLAIGVPYKDKSNAKRFNGGLDLRCRGNLWEIPYQTINKKIEKLHNDRFPIGLPTFCIKLSNVPDGGLVLDPFAGSGTTPLAAKNLNKRYIAFDLSSVNVATCEERLKN